MKHILVPVDFSDLSYCAARLAVQLAEKYDSKVTLLNSTHFDYLDNFHFTSFGTVDMIVNKSRNEALKKMEDMLHKLNTRRRVEILVNDSYLIETINEKVRQEHCDLVVMGTKGASGISEVLVGSNTEKVVRHACCPVIAVPGFVTLSKIHKIVVPIAIDELKGSFLSELADLQYILGANLEFLWVRTPHNIENESRIREDFEALKEGYNLEHATLHIVRSIFPSDGIMEFAESTGADMLAMSTHARRGLLHWLSGSLTEDTVNHSLLPVWTFRMDPNEESLALESVKNAEGLPEYKRIHNRL